MAVAELVALALALLAPPLPVVLGPPPVPATTGAQAPLAPQVLAPRHELHAPAHV